MSIEKMCKNKARFSNQMEAFAHLGKISIKYKDNKKFRLYRCPLCRGYHLTSQERNSLDWYGEELLNHFKEK